MVAGKFEVSRKKARPRPGAPEYTHYSPNGQTESLGHFRLAARSRPAPDGSTQAEPAVSATGALLNM